VGTKTARKVKVFTGNDLVIFDPVLLQDFWPCISLEEKETGMIILGINPIFNEYLGM